MTHVDYITDESLRDSLLSDLKEIDSSIQQGNFKAAQVLAGSVIEAVLVDHVISAQIIDRDKALKTELGYLIDACRKGNVISQRTADLCSVIRSYRNLIHPGRVVRLNETVDVGTANVARALIGIVVGEIANVRLKAFGPTAAQVAMKLENDSSASDVIPHLLNDVSPAEVERLLLNILPSKLQYLDTDNFAPAHIRESIRTCFRLAFDRSPVAIKQKVSRRFAMMVRNDSDENIQRYGDAFFQVTDLQYLFESDQSIVKAHIFGKFKRQKPNFPLERLQTITSYLQISEAASFIDLIVRPMFSKSATATTASRTTSFLSDEFLFWSAEFGEAMIKRLGDWRNTYLQRDDTTAVNNIDLVIRAIEIPF